VGRPRRRLLGVSPALALLLALHLGALVADPLAPYAAGEQHRDRPYAPPTRVHLVDALGGWHLVPFVYATDATPGRPGGYVENTSRRYPLQLFRQVARFRVAGLIPCDRRLVGVDEPATLFVLGTDRYGRDVLSRVLVGARLSLFAGLVATALGIGLGLVVGGVAGYFGGWLDGALTWVIDVFLSLPWLYLPLGIRSLLPLDLPPAGAFALTAGLVGAVGWARPARIVRGSVLVGRTSDYALAARSCGATELRILAAHVLPLAAGVALTQAAIMGPRAVLAEISLSFLGLGVAEPTPSWGNLAAAMFPPGLLITHWWLAAPLAAMVPVFGLYERAARDLERLPASVRAAGAAEVG
jgi:peptide/nickel transport system permease protein